MSPTTSAIAAIALYSVALVALELKLSHVSPLVMMSSYYIVLLVMVLPLTLLYSPARAEFLDLPVATRLVIGLVGLVIVAADFLFFDTFHSGGPLFIMVTAVVLFPLFSSLIKVVLGGGLPTLTQIVGYAIAAIGVTIATR